MLAVGDGLQIAYFSLRGKGGNDPDASDGQDAIAASPKAESKGRSRVSQLLDGMFS